MEIRAKQKKSIYQKIVTSNHIKVLFDINTAWQMTREKHLKNSSNFMLCRPRKT